MSSLYYGKTSGGFDEAFRRFARGIARATGHPTAFGLALLFILVWGVAGPIFRFSDTWQLVANTITSITTFIMVFVIQSAQNRDSEAIQLKLDELIRATKGAHNALLNIEELSESELDGIKRGYEQLAERARCDLRKGKTDAVVAEVPRIILLEVDNHKHPTAPRANGKTQKEKTS